MKYFTPAVPQSAQVMIVTTLPAVQITSKNFVDTKSD
jgi:hypothetical protein